MNELSTIARELRQGKTVLSFTKGRSMEPLLHEGKTCVVLSPITGELKLGDLPLFQRSESVYVLHRLIGIDGDFYITRGDNCLGSERTPREKFVGVVTEIKRGDKTLRVTDPAYLRYVRFWSAIWPLRKVFYRLRALIHASYRRLRRK